MSWINGQVSTEDLDLCCQKAACMVLPSHPLNVLELSYAGFNFLPLILFLNFLRH